MKPVLWLCAALAAAPAPAGAQDSLLARALDSAWAAFGGPGVSAAVVWSDGRTWTGASGIAGPDRPVTPETVFDLASVTKTYTAALTLQLVEAGSVGLDDTLSAWFPDLPHAGAITVRQLLRHTSGLHDPLQDPDYAPSMLQQPARVWTAEELLARVGQPTFAPGTGWRYSNSGYLALGRILERAGGNTFAALLRDRVLGPVGLHDTHYAGADTVPGPAAEAFIDINNDGTPEPVSLFMPMMAFRTSAGTAGGLRATARDAARFAYALHRGALVSAASYAAMTTWVDRPDGNRYGLGLLRVEAGGRVLLGHRGNSAGFSSAVFHDPAAGVSVAVLTNAHARDVTPVVLALLSAASGASSSSSDAASRR